MSTGVGGLKELVDLVAQFRDLSAPLCSLVSQPWGADVELRFQSTRLPIPFIPLHSCPTQWCRCLASFHSLFSAYPVGFFLGRERLKSGWIQYRTNERRDTLRRESKALDNKHQGHFRRNTTSICPISPIAHVSLSVRHGLVCHIYMWCIGFRELSIRLPGRKEQGDGILESVKAIHAFKDEYVIWLDRAYSPLAIYWNRLHRSLKWRKIKSRLSDKSFDIVVFARPSFLVNRHVLFLSSPRLLKYPIYLVAYPLHFVTFL